MVKIASIKKYGDRGWTFRIAVHKGVGDKIREIAYRTSVNGDGLFRQLVNGDWKQILGCGQYNLPKDENLARIKIVRIPEMIITLNTVSSYEYYDSHLSEYCAGYRIDRFNRHRAQAMEQT